MKEPQSMDECIYFTKRRGSDNFVKVWVFKGYCPSCGKSLMGKSRDPKTGRPKIRAKEYECGSCGFKQAKEDYEGTLTACVHYECKCGNKQDLEIPFKRKKVMRFDEGEQKKKSADALVFNCSKCDYKFLITKRMK